MDKTPDDGNVMIAAGETKTFAFKLDETNPRDAEIIKALRQALLITRRMQNDDAS